LLCSVMGAELGAWTDYLWTLLYIDDISIPATISI
jgi:hypothetical protein